MIKRYVVSVIEVEFERDEDSTIFQNGVLTEVAECIEAQAEADSGRNKHVYTAYMPANVGTNMIKDALRPLLG